MYSYFSKEENKENPSLPNNETSNGDVGNENSDHYILQPISGQLKAKLYRTSWAAINASQPKYFLQFFFDSIRFRVEENQFRDLLSLHQRFSTYHTSLKYRQFRPLVSVRKSPGMFLSRNLIFMNHL
jgi:hypothetical protein